MRQAEELSMTIAPAAATRGASQREVGLPQEKSAISSPEKSAPSASSTTTGEPRQESLDPAERCEAK